MALRAKTVRIALGLPWYDGPDKNTAANQLVFSHYLGRLQERLYWLSRMNMPSGAPAKLFIPPLDPVNSTGISEVPPELDGVQFEFMICEETGCSLPGLARERAVESAQRNNADYILFYDDDMMFGTDVFLRLYLDQKPIVAALAFTGQEPVMPVIYKFDRGWSYEHNCPKFESSPIIDYKRDALQQVDGVGFGMVMIDMKVFSQLTKPWFHSPGMGEDIFFCWKAGEAGIPVHVDTRAKTLHVPTYPRQWHDERYFDESMKVLNDKNRGSDRSDCQLEQPVSAD